jgi:hypothetical protein
MVVLKGALVLGWESVEVKALIQVPRVNGAAIDPLGSM